MGILRSGPRGVLQKCRGLSVCKVENLRKTVKALAYAGQWFLTAEPRQLTNS